MDKQGRKHQQQEKTSLLFLFFTFFKINAFTFGGGYTIVPVIRDEFIKRNRLLEEEQMLDIIALAQSGPGPMAISSSVLIGYRLRGPIGAVTCLLASVLPCLIIITMLYYVYDAIQENLWMKAAFGVMAGAISAILALTTWDMAKTALKKHRLFGIIMMGGAFLASYLFHINTALIIFCCGMVGLLLFSFVDEGKVR